MTSPTIIRSPVLPMTCDAPTHAQRLHLANFFQIFHFAVANGTIEASFDVAFVSELDMLRQIIHACPGDGFFLIPVFGQFDDFRAIGGDILVAFHTHSYGWNPRLLCSIRIGMAVVALQSHKSHMFLMAESNWLIWRFSVSLPKKS